MKKNKIGYLILSCVVLGGLAYPIISASAREGLSSKNSTYSNVNLEQEVNMPDKNLKAALNTKYLHQKEDAPITRKQLRALKGTLYLGNSGISDLTGLEECAAVTGLYLSYNSISDLSPLKNLKNLKRLNATNQLIIAPDVTAVKGSAEVKNLIKDIKGNVVAPLNSTNYTFNRSKNTITFKNVTQSGERIYKFNTRVSYGSKYTTYFSGTVTQKVNIGN